MKSERHPQGQLVAFAALLIAVVSLACVFVLNRKAGVTSQGEVASTETTLARTKREGVLHVGVGGFPPYSILNLSESEPAKRFTGFVPDLVGEIARRHEPPLRVEYHQVNWETMKADLAARKYDFVADPIYATVSRAADFGLSEPYTYTGVACAVVRKADNRFVKFQDLDRDDITISVAVGWTSTEYGKQNLKKPKWKEVPVGGTPFAQLDDVLAGRADVALQDTASVAQYVAAHKDRVKALWLRDPPSLVAAGFLTRKEDTDFLAFLSECIRILQADGTIHRLDERWRTFGYFQKNEMAPSVGLENQP